MELRKRMKYFGGNWNKEKNWELLYKYAKSLSLMKNRRVFVFTALLIFCSSTFCLGQSNTETSSEINLWIAGNMGFTGGSEFSGLLLDFSINYAKEKNYYSFQYYGVTDGSELILLSKYALNYLTSDYDRKSMELYDICYGNISRNQYSKLTYSLGLSFVKLLHSKRIDGKLTKKTSYSVGLPFSAQYLITPVQILAIGIKGYVNLNFKNSLMGLSIGVYLGKVK